MSEIPEDIFQTACGIVMNAKSLKSMLRHKDVVDAIAIALATEREACASIADEHAHQCNSKLNKKRSDHDLAVFESAASEASSIAAAIRDRHNPKGPSRYAQAKKDEQAK